jgi:hypothetical protein
MTTPGTLEPTEPHPAARDAFAWLKEYLVKDGNRAYRLLESFSSVGMSGNRRAEVCAETLRRVLNGESVSDRYLLGLAWTLKDIEETGRMTSESSKPKSFAERLFTDHMPRPQEPALPQDVVERVAKALAGRDCRAEAELRKIFDEPSLDEATCIAESWRSYAEEAKVAIAAMGDRIQPSAETAEGFWLYAYRQTVKQDGVDKNFISLSTNSETALREAEFLGRIALSKTEVPPI